VPSIGTQGGDVQAVARNGCTADGRGLLISSSRAILYAGHDADFATAARKATTALRAMVNRFRA
jgi:orotidine-5'-phosphate decarboxylase